MHAASFLFEVGLCIPILVTTFPGWLSGTEPLPHTPGAVRFYTPEDFLYETYGDPDKGGIRNGYDTHIMQIAKIPFGSVPAMAKKR